MTVTGGSSSPGPEPTRGAGGGAPRGAADRVRLSQAQARSSLRLSLTFMVAAAVAALLESGHWLALHLFLAGAVVLAISGVTVMLTVTWSAAPAPPGPVVLAQRTFIAAGAAGVAAARQLHWPSPVLAVAGVAYLVGLVLLGGVLVTTVGRGVERRFDPAVAAYVSAVCAGVGGVALGVHMAVGSPTSQARGAHVTLNLLGLVGLVVGGTMPYFAATVGRSKMSSRARRGPLARLVGWQVVSLAMAVAGLSRGADWLAAAGLAAYATGVIAVLALLPGPTRRQLRWAGPRLIALWAGAGWWALAVGATAVQAANGRSVFDGRWLAVLVIAGYAQILWGSLAYLLPMLRGGGHERLGEGFAATRSWLGLAAVNVAGVSAALALPVAVTAVTVAVWILDGAWRASRVGTARAERPGTP